MFLTQLLNLEGAQILALMGFAGALFAVLLARYVVIVGPLYLLCWKLLRRRLQPRRIQRDFPPRRRVLAEMLWSLSTFVVFSLVGVTLMEMSRAGWTRMYPNIADHGWGYWVVSIALMLVLHDAYFYWTHRFMHLPGVFRRVHRVHHLSFNPSPWAAFSFHPLEAVIEAGIVLVIAVTIPFHPSAIFVFLLIMTIMNALGHLGYELYPRGFTRHALGQWLTTSVHHNMHHHYVRRNYALYFTWWDRLMGTLDRAYHTAHAAATPRRPAAVDQGAGAVSCAPSVELAAQRNPK